MGKYKVYQKKLNMSLPSAKIALRTICPHLYPCFLIFHLAFYQILPDPFYNLSMNYGTEKNI